MLNYFNFKLCARAFGRDVRLVVGTVKRVVQDLWDEMDPCKFIKEIQSMPEKCKEVLKQKGLATKY